MGQRRERQDECNPVTESSNRAITFDIDCEENVLHTIGQTYFLGDRNKIKRRMGGRTEV